ncbi:hypothetical protein SynROS8604_01203 [Synechococcus sp. ROS8604]|nr:hypothetical protein SynROS8604_01203 [Synechococcus sp. ROS8604]
MGLNQFTLVFNNHVHGPVIIRRDFFDDFPFHKNPNLQIRWKG